MRIKMKNKSLFEKVLSSIAIFSLLLWVIGPEPLYAARPPMVC